MTFNYSKEAECKLHLSLFLPLNQICPVNFPVTTVPIFPWYSAPIFASFFCFLLKFLLDVWDAAEFSYTEIVFSSANSEQIDQSIHVTSKVGNIHSFWWYRQVSRKLTQQLNSFINASIEKPPLYFFTLGKPECSVCHYAHTHTRTWQGEWEGRLFSVCLETGTLYFFLLASTAAIRTGTFLLLFFGRGELLFITILLHFLEDALWEMYKAVGNWVFLLSDYKWFWPVLLSTE